MSDERAHRPVVGMAGAGPLARLTAQAAISLGVEFRVFAATSVDSAARVGCAVVGSSARELASFASDCDVLTFEPDRYPQPSAAQRLEKLTALRPGYQALLLVEDGWQDLLRERGFGVYDGGTAEQQFALVIARSPKGQAASYPVVRMTGQAGAWMEVVAPAPGFDADVAVRAQWLAFTLAGEFHVTGLMAVEFVVAGSQVLVAKITLGPHEAGLWSLDGARMSQFIQLLRAVLDLPLGTTAMSASYTATVAITGGDDSDLYPRLTHVLAADPGVSVHLYDVRSGPGQRVGHVAVSGADPDQVLGRAREAANYLGIEPANSPA